MRLGYPVVVTIGHHHHGPHVDALRALAERCGAVIVRLPEPAPLPEPMRLPIVRVPYAGRDEFERRHFEREWQQGAMQ